MPSKFSDDFFSLFFIASVVTFTKNSLLGCPPCLSSYPGNYIFLFFYLRLHTFFNKTGPLDAPHGGCPGPSHRPHPLCTPLAIGEFFSRIGVQSLSDYTEANNSLLYIFFITYLFSVHRIRFHHTANVVRKTKILRPQPYDSQLSRPTQHQVYSHANITEIKGIYSDGARNLRVGNAAMRQMHKV